MSRRLSKIQQKCHALILRKYIIYNDEISLRLLVLVDDYVDVTECL